MKRLICILLSLTFVLTGCANNNTTNPGEKDFKDYVDNVKGDSDIKEVNKEIIEYSSTDEAAKALEDMGYDIKKSGYATYPTSDYFYPEYIYHNGKIEVIYLPKTVIQKALENGFDWSGSLAGTKSEGLVVNGINSTSTSFDAMPAAPGMSYGGGFIEPSEFNTSEYSNVNESGFLSVKTSPLSTFAADVDTASYANFRSIIRDKISESVQYKNESLHDIRIEEMLNYFNYNFDGDDMGDFKVSAEISTTPWNSNTQLLVMNIKAKELAPEENKGSNLVFLIDTSGSMNNEYKMPLLKESLKLLVNELTENDTISIVTYSGNETVVLEGVNGTQKKEIISAINLLEPYGSTNGEGGIKKAYEIAQKYQDNHSNSRIIMCSDGDLNVGISSEDELHDLVSEKRETGVYLSVLGFGLGNYKDNKMETLADNGNGNYHYIDSLREGHKVLVEDMLSTLVTIADDVKFQVEFNPQYIKGYRKIGYENRNLANEDFHDDTKDGGEVGYGHEVTIVYEIIPADSTLDIPNTDLKYQESTTNDSKDWLSLSIRYKPHGEKESQLLEFTYDESDFNNSPSDDWKFISNVVAFGLVANDSEYKEGLNIKDIINSLNELNLTNVDKKEFLSLVIGYNNYLEHVVIE